MLAALSVCVFALLVPGFTNGLDDGAVIRDMILKSFHFILSHESDYPNDLTDSFHNADQHGAETTGDGDSGFWEAVVTLNALCNITLGADSFMNHCQDPDYGCDEVALSPAMREAWDTEYPEYPGLVIAHCHQRACEDGEECAAGTCMGNHCPYDITRYMQDAMCEGEQGAHRTCLPGSSCKCPYDDGTLSGTFCGVDGADCPEDILSVFQEMVPDTDPADVNNYAHANDEL